MLNNFIQGNINDFLNFDATKGDQKLNDIGVNQGLESDNTQ